MKLSGEPYDDGPDADGTELLTRNQLDDFATIRSERNVGAKLGALYRSCGKPVPETYCWSNQPPLETNYWLRIVLGIC